MTTQELDIDSLFTEDDESPEDMRRAQCKVDILTTVQAIRRLSPPMAHSLTAWTFRKPTPVRK